LHKGDAALDTDSKILIIDDDFDILSLLKDVLHREGFQNIRTGKSGREAIALCQDYRPDIFVLDIMLPDMDGFEVCRQVRLFSHVPVLFLSSKNEEVDKILGLAIGGDDYVAKPFSPREVVYRIKALLRRQAFMQDERNEGRSKEIQIASLRIDASACRAFKHGKEISLTAREFGLLLYLAENRDRIISKERLYEQVWGEDSIGSDNTMMVHVRHLREKIEDDPSDPRLIVTVKGLGYKLVSDFDA
jgi:DNA-binding response OmpR family regulator